MKRRFSVLLPILIALLLSVGVLAFGQQRMASADTEPAPEAPEAAEAQAPDLVRAVPDALADRLDPVVAEVGQPANAGWLQNFEKNPGFATNQFFVQLADPPLAEVWIAANERRAPLTEGAAEAYIQTLVAKQDDLAVAIRSLNGAVLADFQKLFNGLAVEIDPLQVRELLTLPGVVAVSPIPEYQLTLNETVAWVGAETVQQDLGFTGDGITVAVIDSGIDYTHGHLGGSGTITDTQRAIDNASGPAPADLYPTAKVIGGFDFVGSVWPDGPLMPDPNPMDDEGGGVDGHGTHVASIIAGVDRTAEDGVGPGVAPGALLYALKACSSISPSCSGIAIAQSYEFSADPDGNGLFDDRVDVVNLSLGSNYGQVGSADDMMINLLSALGTTVVSSAGNGGDNPYIQGSPSSAESAISVAQSSVPSAFAAELQITDPITYVGSHDVVHYSWSDPWDSVITGTAYHTDNTGCAAEDFPVEVAGQIAVVWRGGCFFSDKVYYAQEAGAIAAVVALVDGSAPFDGAQGSFNGLIDISGFNTTQAAGLDILAAQNAGMTATIKLDPNFGTALPDTIVSSSSRGPRFDLNYLKPEISAPGASLSANSGDQTYSVFGGTSGASPMVAGAVALLLEANGGSGSMLPVEVKAHLMNNAMTDVWSDVPGGMVSPISRQGAGRLDAAAAVTAEAIAWIPADQSPALSFGYEPIGAPYSDSKTVEVLNLTAGPLEYEVLVTYRYGNDLDDGVEVTASTGTLNVPGNGSATFDVELAVPDPSTLPSYALAGGSSFNSGSALTAAEVDGFVTLYENDTNARLRVVHASPDAPDVNVCVDGVAAVESLAFTEITEYLSVTPDDYLVQIEAAGGTLCAGPFVYSNTLTLAADTDYTVAATNYLASLAVEINVDDNTPPAPGNGHVRVAHFSPDAPPVDIGLTGVVTPVVSGLAFPDTTAELPLAAGAYDLEIRVSGTMTVVQALPNTMVRDGVIHTFFAMGEVGSLPVTFDVYAAAEVPGGISLPFHFLPRKAADLSVDTDPLTVSAAGTVLTITNDSPNMGFVEAYPLFDISPPSYLSPGDDIQPVDLACVGAEVFFAGAVNVYVFPISTYESRSHPVNVIHRVYVDMDQDGIDDYVVQNEDLGDGRWVSVQYDLNAGTSSIFYFLDTLMNSNTMALILRAPDDDFSFNFQVFSYDAYFGQDGFILLYETSPADALDAGTYHTYDAANPNFYSADGVYIDVDPNSEFGNTVVALPAETSQIGMMYRYYNGVDEFQCVEMETEEAFLQVAHLAPFAADPGTAVTVTLDSTPVLTNFVYGDSTGYLPIPAGERLVEIIPAGATDPAITGTLNAMAGSSYTAIATGDGVNQPLALLALEDDLSAPAGGNFKLRIGHLAPFASDLADTRADIRLTDGTPVLTDVVFLDVAPYIELPAGTYSLQVTTPGGDEILILLPTLDFTAGQNLSVFATGEGVNQPLKAYALPSGQPGFFLELLQVYMPIAISRP